LKNDEWKRSLPRGCARGVFPRRRTGGPAECARAPTRQAGL